MTRFPKFCITCNRPDHWAKDCPLGQSQQERDFHRQAKAEGMAIFLAALVFAVALVVFGVINQVPA